MKKVLSKKDILKFAFFTKKIWVSLHVLRYKATGYFRVNFARVCWKKKYQKLYQAALTELLSRNCL